MYPDSMKVPLNFPKQDPGKKKGKFLRNSSPGSYRYFLKTHQIFCIVLFRFDFLT